VARHARVGVMVRQSGNAERTRWEQGDDSSVDQRPLRPAARQAAARREVGGRCGAGGRMRERSGPHHDGS
jgi:hypothetical protein